MKKRKFVFSIMKKDLGWEKHPTLGDLYGVFAHPSGMVSMLLNGKRKEVKPINGLIHFDDGENYPIKWIIYETFVGVFFKMNFIIATIFEDKNREDNYRLSNLLLLDKRKLESKIFLESRRILMEEIGKTKKSMEGFNEQERVSEKLEGFNGSFSENFS